MIELRWLAGLFKRKPIPPPVQPLPPEEALRRFTEMREQLEATADRERDVEGLKPCAPRAKRIFDKIEDRH